MAHINFPRFNILHI